MLAFHTFSIASGPAKVTVIVDATDSTPLAHFEHKWKRSFGSGHAALTQRHDWRSHLAQATKQLGLSGVRYHGLFDDDMAVVYAPGRYNFTLIDSTWDFLLQHGVRPIVELSFMPAFVANCTWHGHCKQDPVGCTGYSCTQCNGHGIGPVVNPGAPRRCTNLEFWYQGIKQVPYQRDFSLWFDLVRKLVAHAVTRYGLAEVQKWSFEVWNELWGLSWPIDYMALFNASSRAVKAVHSSLRVGGPATASLAHVSDFVAACDADGIAYDFASTHHYPTDSCPRGVSWDPSCFARDVLRVRRTVPDTLPFLLTEYNVGCCLGYVGHDVATAAAFIFRTVSELNDHLDIYSYWTFTDVFEEGGLPREEFKNVYGAMSVGGIPKPAFRAFELLHAHAGDRRLPVAIEHHPTVHPTVAQALPNVSASHPRHWAVGVPCNVSDDTQLGWTFRGGALAWVPPRASRVEAETQRGEVMPAIFGGSSSGGDGLVAGTTALCLDSAAGDARMQLLPCEYLQPSQEFARGKAASFRQRGKCLAVSHLDLPTYRRIDLAECCGSPAQQFSITGSIESRGGEADATAADGMSSRARPSHQLVSKSGACVAVRSQPAGPLPPPRPPTPPQPPMSYVSALATINGSAMAMDRDAMDAKDGSATGDRLRAPIWSLATLRVFLSFWADPEATAGAFTDRLVTLFVLHDERHASPSVDGNLPTKATLYVIDDQTVNPRAKWQELGSPPTPNAAQLAALLAASQVKTRSAEARRINETCTAIDVRLAPNSAVVVAFGADDS